MEASGLYYLSELVEEHTVFAKRLLSRLIYSIMSLQFLLCVVDRFPFLLTALGIFSHFIYLGNMRRFPFVKLTDPLFVASCGELPPSSGHACTQGKASDDSFAVLVLLNHYLWFKHFSKNQQRAYKNMSSYYDTPDNIPTFTEIASYFGLCVWLVPFALFVSLSASDNVLPTMGHEDPSGSGSVAGPSGGDGSKSRRGQGMAKALVDNVLAGIAQVGATAGWKRPEDRF